MKPYLTSIEVQAERWHGQPIEGLTVLDYLWGPMKGQPACATIHKAFGVPGVRMEVRLGDWVVRQPNGTLHAVKDEDFRECYREVIG